MILHDIPIPTLLVVAGIALMSIAALGKAVVDLTVKRQIMTGVVGALFLAGGLLLYLLPTLPASLRVQLGGAMTAEIDARREWQRTDIAVTTGATVEIAVTGGQWTYWRGHAMYSTGEGTGYICGETRNPAACVEILPMYPPDMLIGRIGRQVFPIGQGTTISAEQDGALELRINDGAAGLHDNDGVLTVAVVVRD